MNAFGPAAPSLLIAAIIAHVGFLGSRAHLPVSLSSSSSSSKFSSSPFLLSFPSFLGALFFHPSKTQRLNGPYETNQLCCRSEWKANSYQPSANIRGEITSCRGAAILIKDNDFQNKIIKKADNTSGSPP